MIIRKTLLVVLSLSLLTACGIGRQIRELKSFANCDFRLQSTENTTLAGVNVQQVQSLADLNWGQAAKLTAAYAQGSLPLNLVVNVQVKNPNETLASMNSLQWIMMIDDKEIVDGVLNDRIAIDPNGGISTLPIRISADLMKVLPGVSKEEKLSMGLGLAGAGNKPTRLTLKVKPSIMVGNSTLKYPGYIKVNQEFGGK